MKRIIFVLVCMISALSLTCAPDGWIPLFDGKTFDGWRPSENKESWKIEDGCLVTRGPRSHLFYTGKVMDGTFRNFEFRAEVKTEPGSNSGIYFHTEYQEEGWPGKGYECQVINSPPHTEPGAYVERKMTGSLYGIRNVWKSPARDNEWFDYRILVQGKTVRIFINGLMTVDYTEPGEAFRREHMGGRGISSGTFAFQCHDPGSVVYYRKIRVKPLPDDLPTPGAPPGDLEFEKKLLTLAGRNFPLVDLHAHLKGGLTMEQALENARKYGFTCGFAVNCGLKMGIETEESLKEFLASWEKPPHTFLAMQAEGREWPGLFSKESVSRFDYVFTDAMTWTNTNGRRMRLWIKEETEVGDPETFMEELVSNIEKILDSEPVDIYVNPTFIPDGIAERYDELWTPPRMDRVIEALVRNGVALEINARRRIPSREFIKRARERGVQFTFGTNNGGANDLGRLEYCIDTALECGLSPDDMWMPEVK